MPAKQAPEERALILRAREHARAQGKIWAELSIPERRHYRHLAAKKPKVGDAIAADRACFLHVGTVKTGSSALQYALAHSRQYLLDNGYDYPIRARPLDLQTSGRPTGGNATQVLRALRSRNAQGAAAIAARLASDNRHLVLSSEGLFSCAGQQLDEFCVALRLMGFVPKGLVIFRPQTELLVSAYLQLTKANHQKVSGGLEQYVLKQDLGKSWNWLMVAQKLERAFGSQNLTVRWWPELRRKGAIAGAAFEWLGLPTPALQIPVVNPSPSREATAVLEQLNAGGLGGRALSEELLRGAHEHGWRGSKVSLANVSAQNIFNATRESNEQLLRRYCPSLSPDEELKPPAPYFEQPMDQSTLRALTDLATMLLAKRGVEAARIRQVFEPLHNGEAAN